MYTYLPELPAGTSLLPEPEWGSTASAFGARPLRRTRRPPNAAWRRRKSAKMAFTLNPNSADSLSRVRRTSDTIGSSHIQSFSHQFFGGTNNRHSISQTLADHRYSPCDLSIGQVFAVPGQQKIHRVN